MSVEKNKEELKERLIKGAALSDDELENVSGGAITVVRCRFCGQQFPSTGKYFLWHETRQCIGGIPGIPSV